jgi:hypothetical protein
MGLYVFLFIVHLTILSVAQMILPRMVGSYVNNDVEKL